MKKAKQNTLKITSEDGTPLSEENKGVVTLPDAGCMDLRDWFAGQALTGVLYDSEPDDYEFHAKTAYQIADAMLKEREKK